MATGQIDRHRLTPLTVFETYKKGLIFKNEMPIHLKKIIIV